MIYEIAILEINTRKEMKILQLKWNTKIFKYADILQFFETANVIKVIGHLQNMIHAK